jgi:hypothetical protein
MFVVLERQMDRYNGNVYGPFDTREEARAVALEANKLTAMTYGRDFWYEVMSINMHSICIFSTQQEVKVEWH